MTFLRSIILCRRKVTVSPCWVMLMPPAATLLNVFSDRFVIPAVEGAPAVLAVADSVTHSVTGVVLTVGAITGGRRPLLQRSTLLLLLAIAWLASTFIDVDHFVRAGALSLYKATHLTERPFLHNTSTVCMICVLLGLACELINRQRRRQVLQAPLKHERTRVSCGNADDTENGNEGCIKYKSLPVRGYVPYVVTLCVALLAHHTRDALRRGFWLGPVNTRAISYLEMMLIFYGFVLSARFCADRSSNGDQRRGVFSL